MSTFSNIVVVEQGPVVTVTVSRPKALNSLDKKTLEELKQALVALPASARVMILQGAGDKAFAAGADLVEMANFNEAEAIAFSKLGHEVMSAIEGLRVPVIAQVGGYCLGGGFELAIACDFIVASNRAIFGLPEVTVGVIPGFGGLRRLSRRIGIAATAQLAYTAVRVRADEAKALGIVAEVVEPDWLTPRVLELAQKIAEHAPLAVTETKRALYLDPTARDAKTYAEETAAFGRLFSSADQKEGMKAFVEKREPKWTSR